MGDAIVGTRKRGRPRVGAVQIGLRIPPDQLARVDNWIIEHKEETGEELTRPEAVRRLLEEGVKQWLEERDEGGSRNG